MRILMIAHTFYPEGQGGVEKHVLTLANYLMEANHDVGVFYRIHSPDRREYDLMEAKLNGIRMFKIVHNFTDPLPNPFPFYDRQVEERFLAVSERFRPDLIHVHHLGGLSTSLIRTAKTLDLPVLWTLHDFWPLCPMSHLLTPDGRRCSGPDDGMRCVECVWLRSRSEYDAVSIRARLHQIGWRKGLKQAPKFIRDFLAARIGRSESLRDRLLALPARADHMRRTVSKVDLLVSPSEFLIDKFETWGVPRSRFVHVQNGVPRALLSERHRDQTQTSEPFVFGFIGSIYPGKGVHILTEAFRQADLGNAELRIWGAAKGGAEDYLGTIRNAARRSDRVSIKGRFEPEELIDVMRQIDVLVVPSLLYENNPLTILEAFAMKTPVIASDVGGMAELVQHGQNGLLFSVGNAADLADKMRDISHPAVLEQCRAGIAPPQSVSEMGAEMERIYQELAGVNRDA